MTESNEMEFRHVYLVREDLTLAQLEADVLTALQQEVEKDETLAKQLGLPGNRIQTSPFKLKMEQGVDPLTAGLIVTLSVGGAKLAVKMANNLWDKIILPRLIEKYGVAAVRRRK